ncbi:MAG: hypothetical protein R8K20_07985 [Gallionellaceae bacterium]
MGTDNAIFNILLFTIFFSVAAPGYAEESLGPKKDDAYTASQKQALKKWKKMRKDSELSESAGKRSVLSIFTIPKQTKKISKSKTRKTKSRKAKKTKSDKSRNTAEQKTIDSNKKSSQADAGKAKTPDGSTRSQY